MTASSCLDFSNFKCHTHRQTHAKLAEREILLYVWASAEEPNPLTPFIVIVNGEYMRDYDNQSFTMPPQQWQIVQRFVKTILFDKISFNQLYQCKNHRNIHLIHPQCLNIITIAAICLTFVELNINLAGNTSK